MSATISCFVAATVLSSMEECVELSSEDYWFFHSNEKIKTNLPHIRKRNVQSLVGGTKGTWERHALFEPATRGVGLRLWFEVVFKRVGGTD
jgi:hypothetical protein